MFLVRRTQTAVNQFSAAAPIVTFAEATDINAQPQNVAARIMGYSYTSLGTAHDARLVLAPAAGGAGNLEIVLEIRSAINSFTNTCGPGGFVVPRLFGNDATDGGAVTPLATGATYVVLFSTSGAKDDTATFCLWYAIGDVDSTHE